MLVVVVVVVVVTVAVVIKLSIVKEYLCYISVLFKKISISTFLPK
jgi:hypothetical protein